MDLGPPVGPVTLNADHLYSSEVESLNPLDWKAGNSGYLTNKGLCVCSSTEL